MTLIATFDRYAHQLDTKAAQLQQGTQIIKAGSMLSTTLGLIGLAGTGLGALPLAVGLGLYGFVVSREQQTTGRFMPLPWSQSSGAAMAASAIQQDIESVDIALTDYDYLSQDDKADYTLFSVMSPVIAPMLEGATPVQQERWLTQARRSLIKHHADLISDPELMAPALYGSIEGARGAFAQNLPDELQERISPRILQAATQRRDFSEPETIEAEVVSEAIAPPPPPSPTKNAYDSIVASPYRSRFFLGGQRTGKSCLAVHCALAAKGKGTDIYYLNLSAWGEEDDGYSAIAIKSITANIQGMAPQFAEEVIEDARKLLQAFFISDKPAILVLEEWCELGSRNHQHRALLEPLLTYSASIVEQLANTGQKRRKAVYATGPMFVAGSLQQATKAAKSMALVLVAIAPGKTLYWQEQALNFDPAVFSMALANWHGVSEPVGNFVSDRIALVDGQWVPVGELPALPVAPRVMAKAPVDAPAAEHIAAEATPAIKPPANIPGLSKTLPEAAAMVARHLQKNEGTEATMGAIAKVFRSDDREAIRPLLQSICLTLVSESPANYIYKCGHDGKAKITYQSDPLLGQKWTGDGVDGE